MNSIFEAYTVNLLQCGFDYMCVCKNKCERLIGKFTYYMWTAKPTVLAY